MGKYTLVEFLAEYIKNEEDVDREHWYLLNLGEIMLGEMGPLHCAFDFSYDEFNTIAKELDRVIKDKFYNQIEEELNK